MGFCCLNLVVLAITPPKLKPSKAHYSLSGCYSRIQAEGLQCHLEMPGIQFCAFCMQSNDFLPWIKSNKSFLPDFCFILTYLWPTFCHLLFYLSLVWPRELQMPNSPSLHLDILSFHRDRASLNRALSPCKPVEKRFSFLIYVGCLEVLWLPFTGLFGDFNSSAVIYHAPQQQRTKLPLPPLLQCTTSINAKKTEQLFVSK